jgi:hypothetical protein
MHRCLVLPVFVVAGEGPCVILVVSIKLRRQNSDGVKRHSACSLHFGRSYENQLSGIDVLRLFDCYLCHILVLHLLLFTDTPCNFNTILAIR